MRRRPCWDSTGWCPWCYSNVRGRGNHRGHRGYVRRRRRFTWETVMTLLRRSTSRGPEPSPCTPMETCPLSTRCPAVIEFLCSTRWPDGSARLVGTLTCFSDGGPMKACLNDHDGGLVCFVSASSFSGVLG